MATGKWPVVSGGGGGSANLIEISTDAALPGADDGKIYITTDKGIMYRWVNGGWNSYVAYTEYDTTAAESGHLPGRLTWDSNDGTLKLDTEFTDVSVQMGQELQTVVYNNSGSLIPNGSPVYGSGADVTNDRLTIALSQSNSFLSLRTVGVTTQDIANGSTGAITTHGIVRDVDLSSFSVGDPLWVDETVAGTYRNTKPAAPNYSIIIGIVLDNSVSGILLVDFRIGNTLAASSDADISGLSDRDILQYDAATFTWKNVLNSPLQAMIGMSNDKPDITLRESAGDIYLDLEKEGGGDILYFFQDGNFTLDCTTGGGVGGKATVVLTEGASASSPTLNYIYVTDGGTATLTASTSFPTGEFCWVGTALVPDSATFLTEGPYGFQRYSDSVEFVGERGALSYERERIRQIPPSWDSGVQATTAITTNVGVPDNVYVGSAAGIVYQMHRQNFPVFTSGASDFYVANDSVSAYTKVTDLADLLTDATGASMSASRFSLVLWGAVNKDTGDCKLFINLPNGTYNTDLGGVTDPENFAVTTIPSEFKGTGFLICRLVYRHQTNSGGTWTNIAQSVAGVNNIDLRGVIPGFNLGAASTPSVSEFSDDVFRINDNTDPTKQIAFESSGITTGTTRTLTSPNKSGTILLDNDLLDGTFRINDDGDPTKQIAFEASGITTATTRTFTAPNKNGTMLLDNDLLDGTFRVSNTADSTKKAALDASTIDTATTRTYVAPNKNGTMALLDDIPAAAGLILSVKTADFAVQPGFWYLVDSTLGPITATVDALALTTETWRISDDVSNFGTNACTIVANAADTLNGKTQIELRHDGEWVKAAGDLPDNNWVVDRSVIAGNGGVVSEWEDFTPSWVNVTTPTTTRAKKRRVGENMEVVLDIGSFTTAGVVGLAVPDSLTTASGSLIQGDLMPDQLINSQGSFLAYSASTTNLQFFATGNNLGTAPNTTTGNTIHVRLSIPIAEWQGSGTTNLNSDAIKRTKVYSPSLTSTPGYSSTLISECVAYADSDDNWRMTFNVGVVIGTATSIDITIDGVVFSSTTSQAVAFNTQTTLDANRSQGYAFGNSGILKGASAASRTNWVASGDVALESEPTWAAANLEKNPNVGVEEATTNSAGLIPKYSEGAYTPTLLRTSQTFSNEGACYYQVGNKVHVWGYAESAGTGSGALTISLPIAKTFGSPAAVARQEASGSLVDDSGVSGIVGIASGTTVTTNGGSLTTVASGLRFSFSYTL
jgi:hypothetical protein